MERWSFQSQVSLVLSATSTCLSSFATCFSFPAYSFPSEFVAYRPPQAATRNSASIDKITSCEDTFAALSSSGEVFTFSLPPPPDVGASATKSRFVVQPQRVWALRKQFSAVRVCRPLFFCDNACLT